jgi:hypothetical protein
MLKARLFALLYVFGVAGCAEPQPYAVVEEAHLYPVNQIAASGGVLIARYINHRTGHGEISVTMPDGELLQGEYSVVSQGTVGFGSIYASTVGSSGWTNGRVSGWSSDTARVSPVAATAYGNRGTLIQCDLYIDNVTNHGYGGCKSSKGGLYRAQF